MYVFSFFVLFSLDQNLSFVTPKGTQGLHACCSTGLGQIHVVFLAKENNKNQFIVWVFKSFWEKNSQQPQRTISASIGRYPC